MQGQLVNLSLDSRNRVWLRTSRAACAAIWFGAAFSASAFAQNPDRLAAGEAAWDKAGCLQCHGSTGEGGVGGEFPAGPSLRKTRLDRAALIEAISCGLPGTQMPSWLDGAYTQRTCYGFPPGLAAGRRNAHSGSQRRRGRSARRLSAGKSRRALRRLRLRPGST